MAVEKLSFDLFNINPISASRIALEETLAEFQQVCDHVPCRIFKRKLKKNIGKVHISFDSAAAAAAPAPAPPAVCEKKAKPRK